MNWTVYSIYSSFKYGLFYEMKRYKLEKCWFYDYQDNSPDYGKFRFRTTNALGDNPIYPICNIDIIIDEFGYEYYDELVDIFKSYVGWQFEIGEYDYGTDTFDIIFKRPIYGGGIEVHPYGISIDGLITKIHMKHYYGDFKARQILADICDRLPVFKELPDFKFNSFGGRVPILSKPPIFNPPATVCYWTDGTRTVVKCQDGDTYSPEAGLALCYMKKVLGNTSRDLNKELHKYIPEEKENK